MQGLMSL